MKVLLVNGSPHKNGCTYTALCEVAKALNEENIETEIFWIQNKPIGGCISCHSCTKLGKCVFDDVVNEFREKLWRQMDLFSDLCSFFFSNRKYHSLYGQIVLFRLLRKQRAIIQIQACSSNYLSSKSRHNSNL